MKQIIKAGVWALILSATMSNGSSGWADSLTYQPGPTQGQDAWITSYYDYGSDYGVDDSQIRVGGWGDMYAGMIRLDLAGLPKAIVTAKLWLYCEANSGGATTVGMKLYRVATAWSEASVGWYSNFGYYNTAVTLPRPTAGSWYSIDLTAAYRDWQNGVTPMQGIMLMPTSINNNFNLFISSDSTDVTKRPKLEVTYTADANFKLSFPLKDSAGKNLSPYKTRCVGIPDLDAAGGRIKSYNGLIADSSPYTYSAGVVGYKQASGQPFSLPLLNYDDEISPLGPNHYLFYDGHSGHDYPQNEGVPIYAAGDGLLAVGVTQTSPGSRSDGLWRNQLVCPKITDKGMSWDTYHTFYIIHQGVNISTWYLHVLDLDPVIMQQIKTDGFAKVVRGQKIGRVGNKGSGGFHLHFGVKRLGDIIDPYGNGSPSTSTANVLWDVKP